MFRFTIRDVLWLTVVVGMGVAWWGDRTALRRAKADAERRAAFSAEDEAIAAQNRENSQRIYHQLLKALSQHGWESTLNPDGSYGLIPPRPPKSQPNSN